MLRLQVRRGKKLSVLRAHICCLRKTASARRICFVRGRAIEYERAVILQRPRVAFCTDFSAAGLCNHSGDYYTWDYYYHHEGLYLSMSESTWCSSNITLRFELSDRILRKRHQIRSWIHRSLCNLNSTRKLIIQSTFSSPE